MPQFELNTIMALRKVKVAAGYCYNSEQLWTQTFPDFLATKQAAEFVHFRSVNSAYRAASRLWPQNAHARWEEGLFRASPERWMLRPPFRDSPARAQETVRRRGQNDPKKMPMCRLSLRLAKESATSEP